MEPTQTPQTPPTNPAPAPGAVPTPPPATPAPAVPVTAPPVPAAPTPMPAKKSHTRLLIAVIVVVALAVLAYLLKMR